MPSAQTIRDGAKSFVGYVFIALCCGPCFVYFSWRGLSLYGNANRKRPTNPPALPTTRIDIRRLPICEQPQSCHMLKLPLELRECIYEHALGGRLIVLGLHVSKQYQHFIVRSQCYRPLDDFAHTPEPRILPLDPISKALLLSCRQVYTEALPVLHRRNTFHIRTDGLVQVVCSGLGYYCLADIRSVYIHDCNFKAFPCKVDGWREFELYPPSWEDLIAVLDQMGLERLAFEFELEPQLNGDWGRCVLGLKNLRRFEIWFNQALTPPVNRQHLFQKLRQLVLSGAGVDERYDIFHAQQWEV